MSDSTSEGQSVSQIDYWNNDGRFLSYNMFLGLSVLFGFLALDHLYLRSPLTFLAKILVNVFFLGTWWLYDASQAIFNTDVVKVYGLGVPGLGPKGIGAGFLANDVPDKKHMSFFIYAIALFFGGIFGLDSFLVGDNETGLIRLTCFVSIIGTFIAIIYWLYQLFCFFFKTKDVIKAYPEYFGSTGTGTMGSAIIGYLTSKFPVLGPILNTVKKGQTVVPALVPVATAVQTGLSAAETGLSAIKEGIQLGKTVVESSADIAEKTLSTIDQTAKSASSALTLAPAALSLSEGVTSSALKNAAQSGGSKEGGIVGYVFLGTIGLIAVSGFVGSYLRSNKNANPSRDDPPPEPRVLRKPDQEKSTRSS